MYIQRDIDKTLQQWKEEKKHKPLLLRGVRQCGKTSAVRHLSEQFENYIEINFEKHSELCSLFEGNFDIKAIIIKLELYFSSKITAGKTLLFIDEIQECPRAVTALRYFYEDMPELHVIAAGSLLEFVLNGKGVKKETIDFPVGRVRSIFMYPFSFTEYLRGTKKEILADYLKQHDGNTDNPAHEQLISEYKTFLVVGGMPEAIAEYIDSGSLFNCQQIHRDIITNFIDDFNKYRSDVPADIIRKVFDYAVHNVCGQTKSSSAIKGISAYYFDTGIDLLRRAGLVYPVKASSCDTIPLGSCEKETNKKLLLFDTGIYLTVCGLNTYELLSSDIFDEMNKGNVVEMQTGLEIIKYTNPYTESSLHYWYRSGANAEIDYAIIKENTVIPVEVKAAGKGSMQSMHSFLETHPSSKYGIRVSLENFNNYDNIRVYPVYAVSKFCT